MSTLFKLAALMLLLIWGGFTFADEPARPPASLFVAARQALAEGQFEKTRVLGFHDRRKTFSEFPTDGILIGFDVGVGKFGDIDTVYALRPIYLTPKGEGCLQDHGLFTDRRLPGNKIIKSKVVRTVPLRARSGYAVSGITLRTGLNINGLSLTYMRINGFSLDPGDSYTSKWVGDRTGGGEAFIGTVGYPIVGLFGSQDEQHVSSLGLHFALTAAPRPDPPKVEKPVERPVEAPKAELPRAKANPVANNPAPPAKAPEAVEKLAVVPPATVAQTVEEEGLNWLPVVIFAGVTVPIFFVLFLSLDNKKHTVECGPFETHQRKALPDAAVLAPAPTSTGICSHPGGVPTRGQRIAGEGITGAPATVRESHEERQLEASPEPLERPWWVIVGLWKVPNRQTAWLYFWISLVLAVAPGLIFGLFEHYLFYSATFIAPSFWYWMCIRWADEHDAWDSCG